MTPLEQFTQESKAIDLEYAIYKMVDRIAQAERKLSTCTIDETFKWTRTIVRRHLALRRLVRALRRSPAVGS